MKKIKKKKPLKDLELDFQIRQYQENLSNELSSEKAKERARLKLEILIGERRITNCVDVSLNYVSPDRIGEMFGFDRLFYTHSMLTRAYSDKKRNAKQRGIIFDLSFETFVSLKTSQHCYYTGKKFTSASEISLDRLDNNKGYEEGNVVACLTVLNSAKTDFTIEEIACMYKRVMSNRQSVMKTILDAKDIVLLYEKITNFKGKRSILDFNPC